ncbi:MAG TPA: pyridoxamine 5'-phosphate oxidase [Roseiflexaceae bacterium]|nr:pyridoxamine 5'-phosphate oxidase [Roseiflexaceae bacterium]
MSMLDLRQEYTQHGLDEADADPDPIRQFRIWFDAAVAAGLAEPNAMTLATATPDGRPSARIVLLKGFDEAGFVFFTNYESRKGRELAANPWAALVLHWQPLARQVRIEGRVAPVASAESDAYFATRPLGAQLGAWASAQSRPIPGRAALERRVQELEAQFQGGEVPRPPHWGGYRLAPERIEFWQGRPSRLHDRLLYTRAPGAAWEIQRLAP